MIIRRHHFDRFRQSDCPGSGSCHQAFAWRLSSGLPRPRRVLPGITPSSTPLTTNPLVDGQGRGARFRARLSTPGYPSTDDPPGSAQVAEPNRPHCPPASKPARSEEWLVPPSMCAAWLVPSRHRDTATEGTEAWQSGDEREGLAGWPWLVTLVLKGPLPGHVVALSTLLASGSVKPGGLGLKVKRPGALSSAGAFLHPFATTWWLPCAYCPELPSGLSSTRPTT